MPKPQQPELRRSGKGSTDQDGKDLRAGQGTTDEGSGGVAPVPEENKPGHQPETDEDKPSPPDA